MSSCCFCTNKGGDHASDSCGDASNQRPFLKFASRWFGGFLLLAVVNFLAIWIPSVLTKAEEETEDSNADDTGEDMTSLGELATGAVVGIALFAHFVVDPWWFERRQKKTTSSQSQDNNDEEECNVLDSKAINDNIGDAAKANSAIEPTKQSQPKRQRLLFLDNVKIFLTALVVTFHLTKGFGCDKEASSFLVIGLSSQDPTAVLIRTCFRAYVTLNQGFFMPLFFFVSGYFVPRTYCKLQKNIDDPKAFLKSKRHRLLWPAVLTMTTIIPACMLVQQLYRDSFDEMAFLIHPGHTWYILWLLIFCWMYESYMRAGIRSTTSPPSAAAGSESPSLSSSSAPASSLDGEDTTGDGNDNINQTAMTPTSEASNKTMPFPNFLTRWAVGAGICGILQFLVVLVFLGTSLVGTMPLKFGAGTCDLFLFVLGIIAQENKWLDVRAAPLDSGGSGNDENANSHTTTASSLSTKLKFHNNPWWFRFLVVLEGTVMIAILLAFHQWWKDNHDGSLEELDTLVGVPALPFTPFGLPFFIAAGIFCVDMGLVLLQSFQQYFNTENSFTSFCSKAAYAVYLIHPLVNLTAQITFIAIYNAFAKESDQIFFVEFDEDDPMTRTGQGGGPYMALIGWIFCNVFTHLIVWPLGYLLTNAPILKTML